MTVQVMNDTVAIGAPAADIPQITQEKPYMYTVSESMHSSHPAVSRASLGFGSVALIQLLLATALGAVLWAGLSFGGDDIRALCESLTELFR